MRTVPLALATALPALLCVLLACGGAPPTSATSPSAPTSAPSPQHPGAPFECKELDDLGAPFSTTPARTVAATFAFDPADRDADGIGDGLDQCPDSAEDGKGAHPFDGCSDDRDPTRGRKPWPALPAQLASIHGDAITIAEQVHFATDSAVIQADSAPLLGAVARLLLDHPDLGLVEVSGHADARGNEAQNKALTQGRAAAVVNALVGEGVAAARLRAGGYGAFCPLDPAATDAAYAKNRRVEFHVLRRGGQPTSVAWGGCDAAKQHGIDPQPLPPPAPPPPPPVPPKEPTDAVPGFSDCGSVESCEPWCKKGVGFACAKAAQFASREGDYAAHLGALNKLCADGNDLACDDLDVTEFTGFPGPPVTAALADACEHRHPRYCGYPAMAYYRGCTQARDPARGVALAKRGCDGGNAGACAVLAAATYTGEATTRDPAAAYAAAWKACDSGDGVCGPLVMIGKKEPALVTSRKELVAVLWRQCEARGQNGGAACMFLNGLGIGADEHGRPRMCDAGSYMECYAACNGDHRGTPLCIDFSLAVTYGADGRRPAPLPSRILPMSQDLCVVRDGRGCDVTAMGDEQSEKVWSQKNAVAEYAIGCAAGSADACVNAARVRMEGWGTWLDAPGGAAALSDQCNKGTAAACALYAQAVRTGMGVKADARQAAAAMGRACTGGFKPACAQK